ncbi:MAG TPA: hypothetical protein VJA20_01220 [Candidatus Nanoarchaeia archaeon]|nr:hypothetical protein [Candidatus Nanoarchaeia archaeon]
MSNKKSTESLVIKNNDKIKTESSEKITLKEFEKMVIDFAKKGLTSEKIGEELRKQKIHPQEYGKKISKILRENNLYVSPDLKNVEEKFNRIKTHFDKNKQDKRALNEKSRVFSQIKRIKEYNQIAQ